MYISICIPTYNRPDNLINCLNSLSLQTNKILKYVFLIMDLPGYGKDHRALQNKLKIKYSKNEENLGAALNFLKASMSESDFIWFRR